MAKDYQTIRQGLTSLPKEQVVTLAGDLQNTKQDPALWSSRYGLTYNRGWALCDGSTFDETKYPELYTALGNSNQVPNGPYRTRTIDVVFDSNPAWTLVLAKQFAYSDNNGQWYLDIKINATVTTPDTEHVFQINGVTWDTTNSPSNWQTGGMRVGGSGGDIKGALAFGANSLSIASSGSGNLVIVNATLLLESKPTWADANLESYPVIAAYNNVLSSAIGLPDATAEGKGLVSYGDIITTENLIYNGGDFINQRGADSASASSRYIADRWLANASGATILGEVLEDGTNNEFNKFLRLTASVANDNWGWFQRIENVSKVAGGKYTLAFEIRSDDSSVSSVDFEGQQNFGTSGSPSSKVDLPSVSVPVNSDWIEHVITFDAPSLDGKNKGDDNNDYFSCGFIQKANITGKFDIRKVRLYPGTVDRGFTRAGGSYAGELALCQRYLRAIRFPDQFTSIVGFSLSNNLFRWNADFTMRAQPSMTLFDNENTSAIIPTTTVKRIILYSGTQVSNPTVSSMSVSGQDGDEGFFIGQIGIFFTGTPLTAFRMYNLDLDDRVIFFDAEL